jgi:FkbM family methyltransferase
MESNQMNNSFGIEKTKLSALEEEVLTRLESLEPLRPMVDRIDPYATVVATMGEWFSQGGGGISGAAEWYASLRPGLEKMPDFVLLDWEGGEPQLAWEETAAKYQANIIPVTNIQSGSHKNICVFCRPTDRHSIIFGLRRTNIILNRFNIYKYYVEVAPWRMASVLPAPIPNFVAARFGKICTVYDALADEESKDTFLRVLKFRETGEVGYNRIAEYEEYAHPLVRASSGDMVIDGGLCDERQTLDFLKKIGSGGRLVGFEPVHRLAENIKRKLTGIPNVRILEYGLWSKNTMSHILVRPNGGSSVVNRQEKNVEICRLMSLDNYVEKMDSGFYCGLIKLDIEGAEIECLKGASETIRRFTPKLQICLYHHQDHYVDIPLMLMQMNLGYRLYIGHHKPWKYDTCLYALPPVQSRSKGRKKRRPALALRTYEWSARAANTVSLFIQKKVIEKSGLFDAIWYLKQYPDLTPAARRNPLNHYLRNGWRQGKDPSPSFSSSLYLQINQVPHGICPLFHYAVHITFKPR